jgi:glucose-6-phosphate 1-dehydrogenase
MPTSKHHQVNRKEGLSAIIVGASGDLALTKIYPALFALFCQDLLPHEFVAFGYSRTPMTDEEFRRRVSEHLTCRYVPESNVCTRLMEEFLGRCHYVAGQYDSPSDFLELYGRLKPLEQEVGNNRLFYMAIPPFLFLQVAQALGKAGLVRCEGERSWARVVIEKPFGEDRESSDELTRSMAQVFSEPQTYRIDHYLGKEVIQNLLVLRFANLIFDPLWNRNYIDSVCISWTEDAGVEGRGGYFDSYGIIRDVMQNHLIQILSLVAMEEPLGLDAQYIGDEKVKVLRCIRPLQVSDMHLGQYTAGTLNGRPHPGYLEEDKVAPASITPTYAAAVLKVHNRRWDGVPFVIQAGKGLNTRMTEIRIRFRRMPANIFARDVDPDMSNELTIRVQPDEHIALRIMNKVPAHDLRLAESLLDLRYASAFPTTIPDAYESLLLDVIQGDKSLFIRADELQAAWDIFTPALHEHEQSGARPEAYDFGSSGPAGAMRLLESYGGRELVGEQTASGHERPGV